MTASTQIFKSVILDVSRIISMRRTGNSYRIVRTANIVVRYYNGYRRTGSKPIPDAAQYAEVIVLHTCRINSTGRTPVRKPFGYERIAHLNPRSNAIQHSTYRFSMALPENGELHAAAYRIFHNFKKMLQASTCRTTSRAHASCSVLREC